MKYEDFIQLDYTPKKDDVVATFYLKAGKMKRAAGAVAAESSVGTWTSVKTETPRARKIAAKVFEIKGKIVKIAYPIELFELGNIPQFLSSIAGNIFGMKELEKLKLLDVSLPKKFVRAFPGPKYGIKGIRKMLKVKKRPLIGTIVKPKLGLDSEEHALVAYEAWLGGCDIVKDDENLTSQNFNRFVERIEKTLKFMEKAEAETGEPKTYLANVTAECFEMLSRAKILEEYGAKHLMIDVITSGFSSVQMICKETKLAVHGHRAGHAAFTRHDHGISMLVVAKLSRLVGVDQLHTGTAIGKMEGSAKEVKEIDDFLRSKWFGLRTTFPVASGGLHPGHVPKLIKMLGKDIIIQAGGGIHGHPKGTIAGAKAMRQAVEAVMEGYSLKEFAKKHPELKEALQKWRSV